MVLSSRKISKELIKDISHQRQNKKKYKISKIKKIKIRSLGFLYKVIGALSSHCITFLFKYLKSSQRLNQFYFFCKWNIKSV